MAFSMLGSVFRQMFKKPWTNKFPVKYTPKNTTKLLEAVGAGKIKINPPIETPAGFRGKIKYDNEKCIGCQLCINVCPCEAIEFKPDKKKIKFYLAGCCFCSQCNDICPVKCLSMSNEFLLADTDPYSKDLIVE
ncbi:MAG: 4Fe-4S binding protein [Thermoplasmatales archaeon]|nr:MAG: 4Fe-4S binding protein [Thermoplasmatales archaeon]